MSVDDNLAINNSRLIIENLPSTPSQEIVSEFSCNCPPVVNPIFFIVGPIIALIIAIGVIIFNHKPTKNENEVSNYINAESNQHIHEYIFDLKLGWRKFPWEKILKSKLLKLRSLLLDSYYELSFKPPNDDEKKLEQPNYFDQRSGNFLEVRIKHRMFFFENNITQLFLKTWNDEKSNYKSKIFVTYYPNDLTPTKIIIKNENRIEIVNYIHTLNEIITTNFITTHSDYRNYIIMNNTDIISDCLVENQRLSLVINKLPKKDQSTNSIIINLC